MRTIIKCLIIVAISIFILPLYGVAHEQHILWLSIPLAVGYFAAVSAVWSYGKKDKFELDKTTNKKNQK